MAGHAGIYFINLDGKMLSTDPPNVSERSVDFARGRRLAVYLQSSFDRPAAVVAHGPGMKDPIPLEHFNDALESEWKLGKVEYKTFKGAGDKDVRSGSFTRPTSTRARNGRSCKSCTAGRTSGS